MIRLRFTAALVAALLLTGCSKKDSSKIEEGEAVSSNPFGLARQIAKAGEDLEKIQKDLENMKPVDPIHFSELIKFLPEPPPGWESQPAKGTSNKMGEWSFTEVNRDYTQGDKRMEVKILDWAFRKELYATFFIAAAFSQESTEGYNKGIKIGDEPGREEYKNESKNGTLSMLVGKRFFVTIEGSNIEAAELRQWWDRIDAAGLRSKAGN
jgi:outer membrane murein-binding lipoprotein Lpp